MIFYNIKNTKEFYSKLSRCIGEVDIVSKDGKPTDSVVGGLSGMEQKCNDSDVIKQIELKFHRPEDLDEMLMYVMNRRSYGKYSLKVNELI